MKKINQGKHHYSPKIRCDNCKWLFEEDDLDLHNGKMLCRVCEDDCDNECDD